MAFFDLHCDTLYECLRTGQGLRDNSLALSLRKGERLAPWCQTFAAFIPDGLSDPEAAALYDKLSALFFAEAQKNSDLISPCRTAAEVEGATASGRCAAVLSVENGAALGGDIRRLERLRDDGVRFMTLTWNGDNALASGVGGSGGGLTDFGRECVEKMETLGIFCDVSHLNERGFWEVAEMSTRPFVATHSNFKAECPHRRNLTKEQFLAVCKSGGVVGFNFYRGFLSGAPLESIYRNICLALDLGGEDSIAFGSDFDGAETDSPLKSVDKIEVLCDYLLSKGLSRLTLEKLFFTNALRLLGKGEL